MDYLKKIIVFCIVGCLGHLAFASFGPAPEITSFRVKEVGQGKVSVCIKTTETFQIPSGTEACSNPVDRSNAKLKDLEGLFSSKPLPLIYGFVAIEKGKFDLDKFHRSIGLRHAMGESCSLGLATLSQTPKTKDSGELVVERKLVLKDFQLKNSDTVNKEVILKYIGDDEGKSIYFIKGNFSKPGFENYIISLSVDAPANQFEGQINVSQIYVHIRHKHDDLKPSKIYICPIGKNETGTGGEIRAGQ